MAPRILSLTSARKRLGEYLLPQPPRDTTRVSSFPFVSGDTFRAMAGTEFLEHGERRFAGMPERLAFVNADVAMEPEFHKRYSAWAARFKPEKPVLVIHNSDAFIGNELLRSIASFSNAVYCVNLLEEFGNVYSIPIGLENASLNTNGKLKLYVDGYDLDVSLRTRTVISSFHEQTNPDVRAHVRQVFEKSRFGYDGFRWKLGEYREEIRRTKFVVCPPGNGPDTHRTWEAIYLGAVPVVLRAHLSTALIESNPIYAVDRYEDFIKMSDDNLEALYLDIRNKQPVSAYSTYWVQRIAESLSHWR